MGTRLSLSPCSVIPLRPVNCPPSAALLRPLSPSHLSQAAHVFSQATLRISFPGTILSLSCSLFYYAQRGSLDVASILNAAAAAAAKSLQLCPTLCDSIDGSPPGYPVPGILPRENTGVGCHFLLQCMKVKSESEVSQLCPTLSDPMDHSLPGSSVHGIFQARVLEWGVIALSAFLMQTDVNLHPLQFFRRSLGG